MIATKDPNIFILLQEPGRVVYQSSFGETWEMLGTCNQCGLCEVGGLDPEIMWNPGTEPGQPNACYNVNGTNRLDNPCRPEIKTYFPGCQLTGRYL